MATAIMRSGLRSALRGGAPRGVPASKRTFASSAHHDEAAEAAKWEKITYGAIVTCAVLSFVNLSKGHPNHEEPPECSKFIYYTSNICLVQPYPYLHIRNKEFPWGPDGLFERKHHH